MSDVCDQADGQIEQSLAIHLKKRYPTLVACGRCHYCDETLPKGLLFCDVTCRDWWQEQQDALRRAGKL